MYALFVRSGYELTVLKELEKRGMKGFVPQQIRLERRQRTWHRVNRLLIPSYVFVDIKMTPFLYYLAKGVVGAVAFVGGGEPLPLSEKDEKYIRFLSNGGKPLEPIRTNELENFTVLDFNKRQRKAVIALDFFGEEKRISLSVETG